MVDALSNDDIAKLFKDCIRLYDMKQSL